MFKSLFVSAALALGIFCGLTSAVHAAPPPKAFGELPIAFDGAISPDGKHIAAILNADGEYMVITKRMGMKDPDPWIMRLGSEIYPSYIKWVNNERFMVSLTKPEEFRGTPFTMGYLYSAHFPTREGDFLIASRKMFRQFNNKVIDWLEDDPEHILMAFSDVQWDAYPDIKKVNVNTGRHSTVLRGRSNIEYWMTDDDGTPRIGAGRSDKGKKKMIIFNDATERWDNSDDYPNLDYDTTIYGILKDGRELVVGDYAGQDTLGLYIYDLAQKKITRKLFHNSSYDASGVVLSKDGETVIGAKYTAESDRTELLGKYGTLLTRLRNQFDGYDVDFVDQTEDGRTVLVNMSSPTDPGGMFLYEGGAQPSIVSRMYSGITASDLGEVQAVSYTARDGEKIPAFVTLPPALPAGQRLANIPFIVLPHGGPYARDSKRFDYLAQFFATRGYGVLQMNFRGSEGYGKEFADAGRNNWLVMQEDVEDATRWLLEKGYADPSRTCIAGWSYGGYAALMGAAKDSELYRCVIAMAALTDIDDAKRDLRKYRGGRAASKEFFGEAFQDKKLRRANSPVNVAEDIKVPVFLAHGDQDQNVQFDQFTRMKKAMKKAGVKGTYMQFKDEDHYLSNQANREAFFIGIDKFLTKVNGPSEYAAKD